jgi:ferric-dicitrate binding protein FerR (iron transport regulator)
VVAVPTIVPSIMKSTRATVRPFMVDAAAVAVSITAVPLTVAPEAGAVRAIVGRGQAE